METMTVIVRDRRPEDNYHYGPYLKRITISAFCPKCGQRRGEPVLRPYYEDGESYDVHNWTNPCGHLDLYAEVIEEAERWEAKRFEAHLDLAHRTGF
jgi:hypothetical protein